MEQRAKCPKAPQEFTRAPPAPVFEAGDTWPDWSKKLGDWGEMEWKYLTGRANWDAAHPDC